MTYLDGILEFRGYRFYANGSIWSCWVPRHHVMTDTWRELAQVTNKRGYRMLSVGRGKDRKRRLVHQLILTAFVGPKPPGKGGCHRDGNQANNSPDNLYWGDQADNTQDSMRHGTYVPMKGERNGNAKLTLTDIAGVKTLSASGWSQRRIGELMGVSKTAIRFILQGKTWVA